MALETERGEYVNRCARGGAVNAGSGEMKEGGQVEKRKTARGARHKRARGRSAAEQRRRENLTHPARTERPRLLRAERRPAA